MRQYAVTDPTMIGPATIARGSNDREWTEAFRRGFLEKGWVLTAEKEAEEEGRARLSCYRPMTEESWRRDVVGPLLLLACWLMLAGEDGDAPTWLFWLLLLLPLLLPPPALPASHAINQPNTS